MSPKPRILLVTGIYPPDIGGPATYSKLLFDELPKRGYSVRVLSFGEVRHLPRGIRHIVFMFKVAMISRGRDLIYAQDTVSVGVPARLVSFLLRKRFWVRVPGDYAWEQSVQRFGVREGIDDFQLRHYGWRVEVLRWLQSWVVRGAERVITPSYYFRNLVMGWGVNDRKIKAIYNGIDLPAKIEAVNSWPDRPKTIITAGRLVPWKGFRGLISLMVKLPDWHLQIIGEGEERQSLEDWARSCGVSGRVDFLGRISRAEIFQRLSEARIFMLNTSFESFSFQVVEAMYSGVPVIATAIGSLPELITSGVEGLLVRPDDLSALEDAVGFLTDHPEAAAAMAAAGRIKSLNFSIGRTLDGLESLFKGE